MIDLQVINTIPSNVVIRGNDVTTTAQEGVIASSWNARTGGMTKRTFKGTESSINALALQAQTLGYEYSITTGDVWTFQVTIPTDVITNTIDDEPGPFPTWELTFHPYERDIMESNRDFISELNSTSKQLILSKLKTPQQKQIVDTQQLELFPNAMVAYMLKVTGAGSKQDWIPVLKKTYVVRNDFDNDELFHPDYDGLLFTKTELVNTLNALGNISPLSTIPDVIANQLPEFATVTDQDGNNYPSSGFVMSPDGIVTFVGYLQYPVEIQSVSLQKVSITQEWAFNAWSAGDFGMYDLAFPDAHVEPDAAAFITGE